MSRVATVNRDIRLYLPLGLANRLKGPCECPSCKVAAGRRIMEVVDELRARRGMHCEPAKGGCGHRWTQVEYHEPEEDA